MNNKTFTACAHTNDALDLSAAIEHFVAQGGVIKIVSSSGHMTPISNTVNLHTHDELSDQEKLIKLELLKSLVLKGAGISALQYSLRMNKKDIKQLATEHDVNIEFSRPVNQVRRVHRPDTSDVDDTVAGHAMHYSSLGYTAPEIAHILGLSVRAVWDIGKAYRIEFRKKDTDASP